jgi:hypothetical protein
MDYWSPAGLAGTAESTIEYHAWSRRRVAARSLVYIGRSLLLRRAMPARGDALIATAEVERLHRSLGPHPVPEDPTASR